MKVRNYVIASLVIAVIMAAFAIVTAGQLPGDAMLPTHWGPDGKPDRFSPALNALLMPVGLMLFVTGLFALIPRMEPLQDKLEGSAPVLRASWLGLIVMFVVVEATVGLPAWGIVMPVNTILFAVGLLLVVIGNAMPKSRPGFFVGIRTPWAILDTDNWIATQRLGGKLMMLAGAVVAIASLLRLDDSVMPYVILVPVLVAAFIPYAYSWWLWQTAQARNGRKDG